MRQLFTRRNSKANSNPSTWRRETQTFNFSNGQIVGKKITTETYRSKNHRRFEHIFSPKFASRHVDIAREFPGVKEERILDENETIKR